MSNSVILHNFEILEVFFLNLWGVNLKRPGQKDSKLVLDLCSSNRVFLEIGDAFIVEKYQDYITELATFKNTDLRFCILYKRQLGFSAFCP